MIQVKKEYIEKIHSTLLDLLYLGVDIFYDPQQWLNLYERFPFLSILFSELILF